MALDSRSGDGLTFRELRKGDLPAVSQLQSSLELSFWSEKEWQNCLSPNYLCWVVERNQRLVAYCAFLLLPDEAELLALGVESRLQGEGLGQSLLESGLMLLPDQAKRCLLEVRRSNLPAINLYRKLDFREIAMRRDYYPAAGGIREDAVVMERRCDGS